MANPSEGDTHYKAKWMPRQSIEPLAKVCDRHQAQNQGLRMGMGKVPLTNGHRLAELLLKQPI